jgi:hypothetical protein
MKVAIGRVLDGKVIVDGEPFAEGSVVTVILHDDDEAFGVSPVEENVLLRAIAQAELGEVVSWENLRERLR